MSHTLLTCMTVTFRQIVDRISKIVVVVCALTILWYSNMIKELIFLHSSDAFVQHSDRKSCAELRERNASIEKILNKGCVRAEFVKNVSGMIADLYREGNVRVLPGNGFLLGIIRHGGFLPNEGIDADLGAMYDNIVHMQTQLSISTNMYSYSITMKKQGNGQYLMDTIHGHRRNSRWNESPSFEMMENHSVHSASTHTVHGHQRWLYPRYAVAGYNLDGALREAKTWSSKGSSIRVLGRGSEGTDFSKGKVNLGKRSNQRGLVILCRRHSTTPAF